MDAQTRKGKILAVLRRVKEQEPEIQALAKEQVRRMLWEQHEVEWDRLRARQPRMVEISLTSIGALPPREGMPDVMHPGIHYGPQSQLWPEPSCGHSIFRPEQADMLGPELVALDAADAILASLEAELSPELNGLEQARQDEVAVDAVRAWAMLHLYTSLHRDRPAQPDTLARVTGHLREAMSLRLSHPRRQGDPVSVGKIDPRLLSARAALLDGYPGIEHHAFAIVLD